jgi:hypothetical protein
MTLVRTCGAEITAVVSVSCPLSRNSYIRGACAGGWERAAVQAARAPGNGSSGAQ